jgi:acyl carrier protein
MSVSESAAGRLSRPPSAEQVFGVLRDAIARVLEVDAATVTRQTSLGSDLNADSLALVEVIEIVEEALAPYVSGGFHIDDDDLEGLTTVGAAVDYAVARL